METELTYDYKGRKVAIRWTGKRHTIKIDGHHFGCCKELSDACWSIEAYIDAHTLRPAVKEKAK